MNILLGIGNGDRGDDGIGPFIASRFKHPDWLSIDAGTAPENFTGVVRKHKPELLVLVDAADMGLTPGAIRRIPRVLIQDTGWSTHMLPLYHVIDFLAGTVTGEIIVIGIQPGGREYDAPMTNPVLCAAEEVLKILQNGTIQDISCLA